jgi:Tol biopolymer transport system component
MPNDTTGGSEVLLYDTQAKTLELVSLNDSGSKCLTYVYEPSVDSTGNRIAFRWNDGVYLRDRSAHRTYLTSPGTTGARFPDLSANGRFLAFCAYPGQPLAGNTNPGRHAYFRDMLAASPEIASVGGGGVLANGNCAAEVAVSSNGTMVAYQSRASNLDPNDHNGAWDVFQRTRSVAGSRRVSCLVGGTDASRDAISQGASMTSDGRYVAFMSDAVNLVASDTNQRADAFVFDRVTAQTSLVPVPLSVVSEEGGRYWSTSLSSDGRYCAAHGTFPASIRTRTLPSSTRSPTDRLRISGG